jgi:hypothetical protein
VSLPSIHGPPWHLRLDPDLAPEARTAVEGWVRPLRPASVADWESGPGAAGLTVWVPAAGRPARGHGRGKVVWLRPRHRDLLAMGDEQHSESGADAVFDVAESGENFHRVLGLWVAELAHSEGTRLGALARKQQRAFERDWRVALKELGGSPEYATLFSRFLDAQSDLFGPATREFLEKDLEALTRKLDKRRQWRLRFPDGGEVADGRAAWLFALGDWQGVPLFLENSPRDATPMGVAAAGLIAVAMRELVARAREGRTGPGALVEEAFQALPHPVLLTGEAGEVLQHNTAFARLSLAPSRVARLNDGDQLPGRGRAWQLRRLPIQSERSTRVLHAFLPAPTEGAGGGMESGELGIITSSIAHELNNPLAGLLTALELMRGEEGWDDEALDQLEEMRQGAVRCKQLIDTFLGFSRPRIEAGATGGKDFLKSCLAQALHLHRFRMVESGFRLQVGHRASHPYGYALHAPTTTMVLYLVLGELQTLMQHHKLLSRESARGTVWEGELHEDADNFRLTFSAGAPRAPEPSKLLQYLLHQERVSFSVEGEAWVFRHQNVLL